MVGPRAVEKSVYDRIGSIIGAKVEHADDNSKPGMADALIRFNSGRLGVLEVTSHEEEEGYLKEYAQKHRESDGVIHLTPPMARDTLPAFGDWISRILSSHVIESHMKKLKNESERPEVDSSQVHLAIHLYGRINESWLHYLSEDPLPGVSPSVAPQCSHLWFPGQLDRYILWTQEGGWQRMNAGHPTIEEKREYRSLGGFPAAPPRHRNQ